MNDCSMCSVEGEGSVCKKPRTTNVVVEQAGQTDKLLIDQIADLDSVFEEVHYTILYSLLGLVVMLSLLCSQRSGHSTGFARKCSEISSTPLGR